MSHRSAVADIFTFLAYLLCSVYKYMFKIGNKLLIFCFSLFCSSAFWQRVFPCHQISFINLTFTNCYMLRMYTNVFSHTLWEAFRLFLYYFYNQPHFENYSFHKPLSSSLLSLEQLRRSATDEPKSFWVLLVSWHRLSICFQKWCRNTVPTGSAPHHAFTPMHIIASKESQ